MTPMDDKMPTPDHHSLADIPADEVRRTLRDTQRDHEASLPVFGAALDHAFDPDRGTADGDKARLLGMPDRRGFLKIGGLSVALSAFAVACVYPDRTNPQLPATGTIIPEPSTSIAPFEGSATVDATLVLTAISIEQLAIDTYQAAIDNGWLEVALLQDVAKYFQGQHRDHRGLLSSTATALGQKPADVKANEYLAENIVNPAVDTIKGESGATRQTATLTLALGLEDAAAQTYAKAGGILTTATLRQAITSIGAIENKHYSLLASVLNLQVVPFSFAHINLAAPPDSYVEPNGPVPSTTSTTARATAGTTPGTTR